MTTLQVTLTVKLYDVAFQVTRNVKLYGVKLQVTLTIKLYDVFQVTLTVKLYDVNLTTNKVEQENSFNYHYYDPDMYNFTRKFI